MATLMELMNNLEQTRKASNNGSPVANALDNTIKSLGLVSSSVNTLRESINKQVASNLASRKVGEASDVQRSIKDMLKVKIAENDLERARHERMMDMAESLIPQVTDEQLKAVRQQQLAYRQHQKTLDATVAIEKKKYDLNKKAIDDATKSRIKGIEAERAEANFAIKDKYGTIENAITSMGNSGGDSLSKFLVAGLARWVKEKKEAPLAEVVKEQYDKQVEAQTERAEENKAKVDKAFGYKKEDITEAFAIKAAQNKISDPGSATKLYTERDNLVKSFAKEGETLESSLLSGNVKISNPGVEESIDKVASAIVSKGDSTTGNVPVLTKDAIEKKVAYTANAPVDNKPTVVSKVPEATVTKPVVTPVTSPVTPPVPDAKPAPKNAKFSRAPVQNTAPVTPATKRPTPEKVPTSGPLGNKGGFLDLGGIMSSLSSIANAATKFLGSWSLAANAIMAFDRLVPIVSDLTATIMDISKLTMPLLVSSLIEMGAQLLGGLNGLIEVYDKSVIGSKWTKRKETQDELGAATAREADRQAELKKNKSNSALGGQEVDTTSAFSGVYAEKTGIAKMDTALTSPSEAESVANKVAAVNQASVQSPVNTADATERTERDRYMFDALKEIAHNPGTTPIMVSNPYLSTFPV